MNAKQAKKIRQLYNRTEAQAIRKYLKPKPKWMPKFLHRLGLKIYFKGL